MERLKVAEGVKAKAIFMVPLSEDEMTRMLFNDIRDSEFGGTDAKDANEVETTYAVIDEALDVIVTEFPNEMLDRENREQIREFHKKVIAQVKKWRS